MPIILHSPTRAATDAFTNEFIQKNAIKSHFVTKLEPEGKEFSIKQVRELIKLTVYTRTEPQVFILYNFDLASLEAQNAFLKTLEEHKATDQYIMEVKQPYRLLPTILSRSCVVHVNDAEIVAPDNLTTLSAIFAEPIPPLNHPFFQAQKYEHPLEPFDHLIAYFKSRLPNDPSASSIIKEVLIARSRVRENNLNIQYALDRVLIMVYKNTSHIHETTIQPYRQKRIHAP